MTAPSWLLSCMQPHERSGARSTQQSCSWIPDSQKLEDNRCCFRPLSFGITCYAAYHPSPTESESAFESLLKDSDVHRNMRNTAQEVHTPFGFFLLLFSSLTFSGVSLIPSGSHKIYRDEGPNSAGQWSALQISMKEWRNARQGNSNIHILYQSLSLFSCVI